MESVVVVEDRRVARALTLGDAVTYLRPFVLRAASVAEAAREVGEPIQRVHYHVQRLVHLGLLDIAAVEQRAGRAVKRYRSTAYAYHIPAAILPEQLFPQSDAILSAFMQRALEAARPELVRDAEVRVTFPPDGPPNIDRFMGDGLGQMFGEREPAVLSAWMNLYLTATEAKRLQLALWDLLRQHAEQYSAPTHGRRHVLRVAMAPAPTRDRS